MTALRFERSIEPVLQIKSVRLAVVLGHVEIGDVNFKALVAVFVLKEALKLQENCLLDLIAVVGGQNV